MIIEAQGSVRGQAWRGARRLVVPARGRWAAAIAEETVELQEITVTAQTEQSLSDVSLAVTAIGASELLNSQTNRSSRCNISCPA